MAVSDALARITAQRDMALADLAYYHEEMVRLDGIFDTKARQVVKWAYDRSVARADAFACTLRILRWEIAQEARDG